MAVQGRREKRLKWVAAVPMGILALSCVYPVVFALNNALKTSKEYILDRFGLVSDPTLQNFVVAWGRAKLGGCFINSVITTAGGGAAPADLVAGGLRAGDAALSIPPADLSRHPGR
jgi:multiple sugar transport system permease protein